MITQSCSSNAHSARRLPPAAFDEDVSIVPALPPGGHPHGMFTGRNVPSSRLPDICSTVPAVIPGDPDVPPARSVRAVLVNADRRAQLYHYLRSLGRSYPPGNPNKRVHKKFPHRRILLKDMESTRMAVQGAKLDSIIIAAQCAEGSKYIQEQA